LYKRYFYGPNCEGSYVYDDYVTYGYKSCYYSSNIASVVYEPPSSETTEYNYPDSKNCNDNIWDSAVVYPSGCRMYSGNYYYQSITCSGNELYRETLYGSCSGSSNKYVYSSYDNTCGNFSYGVTTLSCLSPTQAPTPFVQKYLALDYFYSCSDGVPLVTQYYELQKCIPSTYGEYMKYSTVTSDGEIRLVAEYYSDVDCQDFFYSYGNTYSTDCSYGSRATVTTQMDPTSIAIYFYDNVGNDPFSVNCDNSDDWESVVFYHQGCFATENGFLSIQCDGNNIDWSIYSSTTCDPSSLSYVAGSDYADSNSSCPLVNTNSSDYQYSILQCVTSSPSFAPSGPSPAPTPYNQKYFQLSYYYDCTAQSTPYTYESWVLDKCFVSNYGYSYMYMKGLNPDDSLSLYAFAWYSSSNCSDAANSIYSLTDGGVPSSCDSSAPFWIASVTAEISGSVGYKYFEDGSYCESDDWDYAYLLGSGCITVDSSSSYRLSCDSDGDIQEIDYYGSNTCSGSGVSFTSRVSSGFYSIGDCGNSSSFNEIFQFYCSNPITINTPTLAPSTPTVIETGYFLYSEYQAYSQCNMPGYLQYVRLGTCFEWSFFNEYFKYVGILDPETNNVGLQIEYFSDENCTLSLRTDKVFKNSFAAQDCSLASLYTAKIVDSMQPGYIGNLTFPTEDRCDFMNFEIAEYLNSGCSRSSISTCHGSEISTTYYHEMDIVCAGQPINDGMSEANTTCQWDIDFDYSYVTKTCIPQPSASPTHYPTHPPTYAPGTSLNVLMTFEIGGITASEADPYVESWPALIASSVGISTDQVLIISYQDATTATTALIHSTPRHSLIAPSLGASSSSSLLNVDLQVSGFFSMETAEVAQTNCANYLQTQFTIDLNTNYGLDATSLVITSSMILPASTEPTSQPTTSEPPTSSSSSSSIGAGGIAGIVIASVVVAGGGGAALYYNFFRSPPQPKDSGGEFGSISMVEVVPSADRNI